MIFKCPVPHSHNPIHSPLSRRYWEPFWIRSVYRLASAVVIFFNMPLRFLPPLVQFASSQSSNLALISAISTVMGSVLPVAVELRRTSKSCVQSSVCQY